MMHLHFFLLLLIGEAWSATLKDAGAQNYVQDLDDDSKNRQSDTILVIIESFRTIHERLDMLEDRIENEMDGLHKQLKDSDRKIEKVQQNVERNTKLIETLSDTCSKEHMTTAKPSTASPATTPKDWSRRFGNSTYYWSKDQDVTMSWEGAKLWCERMARNSHLAKIETEEENDFLIENFSGYTSWFGANDIQNEGSFRWTDGSQVIFTGWDYDEPND